MSFIDTINHCKGCQTRQKIIDEQQVEIERLRGDAHKWQTYTMETGRADLVEEIEQLEKHIKEKTVPLEWYEARGNND